MADRKLSEAVPQMARFELPLVRDKREKDVFRNKNRLIEISSNVVKAAPGIANASVFGVRIDERTKETEGGGEEKENVLCLDRKFSADIHIEFGKNGLKVYNNEYAAGVIELDTLTYSRHGTKFYILEITPQRAREILDIKDKTSEKKLYFGADLYAVVGNCLFPASRMGIDTIANGLMAGRLFLGQNKILDPSEIDRVEIADNL